MISDSSFEQGELLIKSPAMFDRYLNKPEATALKLIDEGWYATGDIASRNSAGSYKILGRLQLDDRVDDGSYKLTA